MKPVILITHKFDVDPCNFGIGGIYRAHANYCQSIIRAGGMPIISASGDAEAYANIADGIVFTASTCDISPRYYGQENRKSISCDPVLDETELQLFHAFYQRNKPMLGICRGLHLINVALGGTLLQDIPDEVPNLTVHGKVYRKETQYHPVCAKEGSLFYRLFGSTFMTNSYHHQAINDCGTGMTATVLTEEGIIEAIEHESKPIIAAQWHPERMIRDEQEELPDMIPLFQYFIDLCKKS